MKAKDLAARLMKNPDMEIMILDGFNGGGEPRTINSGPKKHKITQENINEGADCEDFLVGKEVLVMGYGSY